MKETRKFLTTSEMIRKRFFGWSGVKCEFCKKETTKAQLLYSTKFFGKLLCRICQSFEGYGKNISVTNKWGENNGEWTKSRSP